MTDEDFVRSKWTRVYSTMNGTFLSGRKVSDALRNYRAAAEFTRERERQIAEIEEEIAYISYDYDGAWTLTELHTRILARLQAALADLKRGMK